MRYGIGLLLLVCCITTAYAQIPDTGKRFAVLPITEQVNIDGQFNETATLRSVSVDDHTQEITKTLASVWLGWTTDGLYVACDVTDATPQWGSLTRATFSDVHKFDSIELWINRTQLVMGKTVDGPAAWNYREKQASSTIQLVITPHDKGYRLEALIPWSEAAFTQPPAAGQPLAISIGINDKPSADANRTQIYAPENSIWGSIASFARCELAQTLDPSRHWDQFRNRPLVYALPDAQAISQLTLTRETKLKTWPIHKEIYGVCAFAPPYPNALVQEIKPFLTGSSIRVWARFDQPDWNLNWKKLVENVQPAWVVGFTDKAWHPEQIYYRSDTDHNLFKYQTAQWLATHVDQMVASGYRLDAYELWNEPEFKVNGHWLAQDYARYVNDTSDAIRAKQPQMHIGAFLRREADWNKQMLSHLKPGSIQFADRHYYNTYWFHMGNRGLRSYIGKIAYTDILAQEVQQHTQELKQYDSQAQLITSEWGIHPHSYGKPFDVCHDIGAVLHHAQMLLVFAKHHVGAAQYFRLSNSREKTPGPLAHFRLWESHYPDAAVGNLRLLQFMGSWFVGQYQPVTIDSPMIEAEHPLIPGQTIKTPLIQVGVAKQDNTLCIVLINAHPDASANVNVTDISRGYKLSDARQITAADLNTTEIAPENVAIDTIEPSHVNIPAHTVLLTRWHGIQ
jgi:hypothetical protein